MTDTDELAGRGEAVLLRAMDGAGTLPAKDSVKVRPADWHAMEAFVREAVAALRASRAERDEARDLLAAWSKQNKHAQDAAEARETALKARVAVLETALEPFDLLAAYLQEHAPAASDNDEVGGVSVSMLRRARSLAQGETT
ncbi:MAG: hypothetical protein K2Z25_21255 [Beijerinckiaceae bacterium]|nr:hypothetical protein [Bradyrhizobium sp. CCH5-A9]MBX9911219.1 hypothetical protein [Beijerinckiaceae bacterium]